MTESDLAGADVVCSVADCFRASDGFEAVMVSAPPEAGSKERLITFVLNVPLCGEHLHLARLADDSDVHLDT
jgi:hypothetical protein